SPLAEVHFLPIGCRALHVFPDDQLGTESSLECADRIEVIRRKIDAVVGTTALCGCRYDRFDPSNDRLRRGDSAIRLQVRHHRVPDAPVNADAKALVKMSGTDLVNLSEDSAVRDLEPLEDGRVVSLPVSLQSPPREMILPRTPEREIDARDRLVRRRSRGRTRRSKEPHPHILPFLSVTKREFGSGERPVDVHTRVRAHASEDFEDVK